MTLWQFNEFRNSFQICREIDQTLFLNIFFFFFEEFDYRKQELLALRILIGLDLGLSADWP